MNIFARFRNKIRAVTQLHGTAAMKRALWNKEFGTGYWNHIANTTGDFVHEVVDRYLREGSIVDLGCGVGSLGIELTSGSYRSYTGVDISDVALTQARTATERAGRTRTNQFIRGDIETYLPPEPVAVILLSECLYYVPKGRVAALLHRLTSRLAPDGVILIRLHDRDCYPDHLQIVRTSLQVIEEIPDQGSNAVIIVCRGINKSGSSTSP